MPRRGDRGIRSLDRAPVSLRTRGDDDRRFGVSQGPDNDGGRDGEKGWGVASSLQRERRLPVCAVNPDLSLIGAIRRALPAVTALEELRDETGYAVSMGALIGNTVTYIHRLPAHPPNWCHIDIDIEIEAHIPIHCTALGKALLASLTDEARRNLISQLGFERWGPRALVTPEQLIRALENVDYREPFISDEEFLPATRSIAMYAPRPAAEPRIAVDVTVPAAHLTADELAEEIGPNLAYAVALISQVE